MLDDLFGYEPLRREPRQPPRRARKGRPPRPSGLHTFVVQKPYCSPSRDIIYTALESYGIPIHNYEETTKTTHARAIAKMAGLSLKSLDGLINLSLAIPISQEATFQVPKAQASWAEYLLESTGKLAITGGRIDKRNAAWGNRRSGRMPTPWDATAGRQRAQSIAYGLQPPADGRPWIESGCSQGKQIWSEVGKAMKKAKKR